MNEQRHVGIADADDVANLRDALNDPERPSGSRIELGEDFASGLLNLIERLRAIEEAARHMTASAGFRGDIKSPFGTEVVVVLRDRFDVLGEALDALGGAE